MYKKFLLLVWIALVPVAAFSQKKASRVSSRMEREPSSSMLKSDEPYVLLPGNWANAEEDFLIYTADGGGYVAGNNVYGDLAKAQRFVNNENLVIHGAYFWVGVAEGTTGMVHFHIRAFDGAPGQVIASKSLTISQIQETNIDEEDVYVAFDPPISISSDFLVGIDMSDIGQDSIALVSTRDGKGGLLDLVWEQFDNGNWYTFMHPSSWQLDIDLGIFPLVSDQPSDPDTGFAGGDGTTENPFQVKSLQQLANIKDHLDAHFIQVADIDITASSMSWEPIGSFGNCFTGTYNGNGKVIYGPVINVAVNDYAGLFGCLENAHITNITLQDVEVSGGWYTGGLAGSSHDSQLQGVHVAGHVSGKNYVGGLAGSIRGGNVAKTSFTGIVQGTFQVGGIAGHITDGASVSTSYTLGSVYGTDQVGGLAGLVDSGDESTGYTSGLPAGLTTDSESVSVTSQAGVETIVTLSDGTTVKVPPQPAPYVLTLEKTSNDLPATNTIHQATSLRASGALRKLHIAGSGDPFDLKPEVTFPASEAGSINTATINVIRIGTVFGEDNMADDQLSTHAISLDDSGNLTFTDYMMPYGLTATDKFGDKVDTDVDVQPWEVTASYMVMSFQDDLNWRRAPQLVRMIPDAKNTAGGYRRPATAAELIELAKKPVCNIVLLVHGHNEEEKEGTYDNTASAPWLFSYKQLVWDLFFREIAQHEEADKEGQAIYPYECTAFYEFIYPTYRPIFSPVPENSISRHETLGESLGLALQREFVQNPQLKAMVDAKMPFNALVVSHSQGGLVARAGLRHMPEEFRKNIIRLVSWGSPHHGAALYTLRYAFQSGHDMILDGKRLPLQRINNTWVVGSQFKGTLNAKVALDTPGIRDLRWQSSLKNKTRVRELFPTITDETEPKIKIPVFSQNLTAFNNDTSGELDTGGYSFFYGTTSKRTTLDVSDLLYIVYELMYFHESTSIEQGATLNDMMMVGQDKINDGAVPIYSQQAAGASFQVPGKLINMGDADHEEFYGAEPGQRTPQALEIGRETAKITYDEAELQHPSRSCPAIEAMYEIEDDLTLITGTVIYPLYDTENGGDGKPGLRMERLEARREKPDGAAIPAFTFTHEDDGTFRGEIPTTTLPDQKIYVAVIFKDGSEVTELPQEAGVTILPPRIVIYDLQQGANEVEHEFEAYATPDSTYYFEWHFGDGQTYSELKNRGEHSIVSHVYKNLNDGDKFYPEVRLLSEDGRMLAKDVISITIEAEDPNSMLTKLRKTTTGIGQLQGMMVLSGNVNGEQYFSYSVNLEDCGQHLSWSARSFAQSTTCEKANGPYNLYKYAISASGTVAADGLSLEEVTLNHTEEWYEKGSSGEFLLRTITKSIRAEEIPFIRESESENAVMYVYGLGGAALADKMRTATYTETWHDGTGVNVVSLIFDDPDYPTNLVIGLVAPK